MFDNVHETKLLQPIFSQLAKNAKIFQNFFTSHVATVKKTVQEFKSF